MSLGRRVVLIALAAGMLWAAPTGASAAGWLAPESMALPVSDLGFDDQGNVVAVGVGAGGGAVTAATRPFGGSWSAFAAIPASDGHHLGAPQLAVDPQGNAVAVWAAADARTGSTLTVRISSRPTGGAWTTPVALSVGAALPGEYDVAIDDQGVATVVWVEFVGSTYVARAASAPFDDAWSAGDAETLSSSDDGTARNPRVGVDSQGRATAMWVVDTNRKLQSKRRTAGVDGTWGDLSSLYDGTGISSAQLCGQCTGQRHSGVGDVRCRDAAHGARVAALGSDMERDRHRPRNGPRPPGFG